MKKTRSYICLAVFAVLCTAVFFFFRYFIRPALLSADTWLDFDSIEYTDEYGNTVSIDPRSQDVIPETKGVYTFNGHIDSLSEGEELRISDGSCADTHLYVNGRELYHSTIYQPYESTGIMQYILPLIPGGEGYDIRLTCSYSRLDTYIFPPIIQIASELRKSIQTASFVNYYAVPAGMTGLLFLLVCGVFLLGFIVNRPDYRLIMAAAATACYTFRSMYYTNAHPWTSDFSYFLFHRILFLAIPLFLLLYIFMNRKNGMLRIFLWVNLGSVILLLILSVISVLSGTRIGALLYLSSAVSDLFNGGYFNQFVALLTNYLILSCGSSAVISHMFFLYGILTETQLLKEKNKVISSGYTSIVDNIRHTAALRHEWKNDLLALYMMYQQDKMEELGEHLKARCTQITQSSSMRFTENFIFDVIMQNTAQKAKSEGIRFCAQVQLPPQLPINDDDLCSLLMNMLDNAGEACARLKKEDPGRERFIDFKAEYRNGFLAICCRNSCIPSRLHNNLDGHMIATDKKDPLSHGYGLRQMNMIAQKYHSLLDIICRDGVFTVQTALKADREENSGGEQHVQNRYM